MWFQPPYYHVDRPRYYKDALFGAFLSYSFAYGLNLYLNQRLIPSKNGLKNHYHFIELIFDEYAKWDEKHHEDVPLPGFLFSNKQFFWFTLIHKNCVKLQIGYKDDFNDEKNAEAYFRETRVFQETFGCNFTKSNLSEAEVAKKFNEFY